MARSAWDRDSIAAATLCRSSAARVARELLAGDACSGDRSAPGPGVAAALVSVGRKGSAAAAGGSEGRWPGTIGVMPGGGGGGTDTGRLEPVPVTHAGGEDGALAGAGAPAGAADAAGASGGVGAGRAAAGASGAGATGDGAAGGGAVGRGAAGRLSPGWDRERRPAGAGVVSAPSRAARRPLRVSECFGSGAACPGSCARCAARLRGAGAAVEAACSFDADRRERGAFASSVSDATRASQAASQARTAATACRMVSAIAALAALFVAAPRRGVSAIATRSAVIASLMVVWSATPALARSATTASVAAESRARPEVPFRLCGSGRASSTANGTGSAGSG